MSNVADWIKESCSTVGTGALTLTGTSTGFIQFRQAYNTSTQVYYVILDGTNREAGIGTFNGVGTITRDTIYSTLDNGVFNNTNPTAISLGGASTVACALVADAFTEMKSATDSIISHLVDFTNPHNVQASQVPYDSSTDPVTNETDVQAAMGDMSLAIENRVPSNTGVISGGLLSGSGTTFSVSSGTGVIIDNYTSPNNTTETPITWGQQTNINLNFGTDNAGSSSIFINSSGVVTQIVGATSNATFRDNIFLGVIYHMNGAITEVSNAPSVIKQTATDVYDSFRENTTISGGDIREVTGQLQVWSESGTLFYPGINYYSNTKDPNNLVIDAVGAADTPITITEMFEDGSLGSNITTIPQSYNSTGTTKVALSGANTTIHRLYSLGVDGSTRKFVLLYGQQQYASASEARDQISTDDGVTTFPSEINVMYPLAYIGVSGNATDFSDITLAWIVNELGNGSSGASGSTDPDAVKWQGRWDAVTYLTNAWVKDGAWGGVCTDLNGCTDRIAPQDIGSPVRAVSDLTREEPDLSYSGMVESGYLFTFKKAGYVKNIYTMVPEITSTTEYELIIVDETDADPANWAATRVRDPSVSVNDWAKAFSPNTVVDVGTKLRIHLRANNPSNTLSFIGPWTFQVEATNPPVGVDSQKWMYNTTGGANKITISATDLDSTARNNDLNSIVNGTIIRFAQSSNIDAYYEFLASASPTPQDNLGNTVAFGVATQFEVPVTLINTGVSGAPTIAQSCSANMDIPDTGPTTWIEDSDYFTTVDDLDYVTVNPFLNQDGSSVALGGIPAFGIDIQFQEAEISTQWDIAYLSESIVGNGNVLEFTNSLPNVNLSAINEAVNSNTVVDAFIYDTNLDDDCGAWTEQTQHTSWYQETLNTSTRGSTRAFPKLALIIAEAATVTIYDLTDPDVPMWMVFDSNATIYSALRYQQRATTNISMKNGILYSGNNTSDGVYSANFIKDNSHRRYSSLVRITDSLAIRNNIALTDVYTVTGDGIVNNIVNDVTIKSAGNMTNLVAVATDGGVSVIYPDGTVYDITDASTIKTVSFYSKNRLSELLGNTSRFAAIPVVDEAGSTWRDFYIASGTIPATSGTVAGLLSLKEDTHCYNSSDGLQIFIEGEIVSTIQNNGLMAYITKDYNTGWMMGDIRRCYLANSKTADRSVKAATLTENGTVTEAAVATGAELKGYSGFSATNYFSEAYSADLDFGTGDFYVCGWFNETSGDYKNIFERDSASYGWYIDTGLNNAMRFRTVSASFTLTLSETFNSGQWTFFCFRRVGGVLYGSINAGAIDQAAYTDDLTDTDATIRVGLRHLGSNEFLGSIALLRIGAGSPTSQQIKRMYEDEKPLFQENANCLINGASSDVLALAHDEVTDELHVSTSGGISTFKGLRRVDEDATRISKTSLAAHNSILADGV